MVDESIFWNSIRDNLILDATRPLELTTYTVFFMLHLTSIRLTTQSRLATQSVARRKFVALSALMIWARWGNR